jgi:uncharacterized protein (TIGR02217 family)
MTIPVFPAPNGLGFSIHKKPTFATLVAPHVSGREVRDQLYLNPIWQFEVPINALDSTTAGEYGGVGAVTQQTLLGFFLQLGGQAGQFIYYDPTDYQVTGQLIGTGDGSTTTFQLARTLGGFSEVVVAPVTATATLCFPGSVSVVASAASIYAAGSLVSSSAYSISSPGGVVTFTSAPASGEALTWTGFFGFLCRFDDDVMDFEQFMSNLWRVESIKFRSLRAQ